MVLERSFDSDDLKRMLLDSEMVMDRSLLTAERKPDPTKIVRPPLPKGSHVFEKVLDEFQPERVGPDIQVTGPQDAPKGQNVRRKQSDMNHLSPYMGRSRSNSRSDPVRSRPGSDRGRSPSRPGSDVRQMMAPSAENMDRS